MNTTDLYKQLESFHSNSIRQLRYKLHLISETKTEAILVPSETFSNQNNIIYLSKRQKQHN